MQIYQQSRLYNNQSYSAYQRNYYPDQQETRNFLKKNRMGFQVENYFSLLNKYLLLVRLESEKSRQ